MAQASAPRYPHSMAEPRITNPKRNGNASSGRESWYNYYAGYSSSFAFGLLNSLELNQDAVILDPWNGVGTTTTASAVLRTLAHGFDLNPSMVVIAKAMLVSPRLAQDIVTAGESHPRTGVKLPEVSLLDPLLAWFSDSAVAQIRGLERALLGPGASLGTRAINVDKLSRKQAFAYLLLFKTVRQLVSPFYASNPTWLKQPKDPKGRLRPSKECIRKTLLRQGQALTATGKTFAGKPVPATSRVAIRVASSTDIPLSGGSVDAVLTSPPYCTRIDYAVATSAELAVLGCGGKSEFRDLREALLGSATVSQRKPELDSAWGKTCNAFLDRVRQHPSKASSTYYYKNHVAYFRGLFLSLCEIARVLKQGAALMIVVQDSYYKEIHNDLPTITSEMSESAGLILKARSDFATSLSMARLNQKAWRSRARRPSVESVLRLAKTA